MPFSEARCQYVSSGHSPSFLHVLPAEGHASPQGSNCPSCTFWTGESPAADPSSRESGYAKSKLGVECSGGPSAWPSIPSPQSLPLPPPHTLCWELSFQHPKSHCHFLRAQDSRVHILVSVTVETHSHRLKTLGTSDPWLQLTPPCIYFQPQSKPVCVLSLWS